MPSASAKLEKQMSTEAYDPMKQILTIVEKKVRNLEKRKITTCEKFMYTMDYLYAEHHLAQFVVDEAHCLTQWGHDFRPAYLGLSKLREKFPEVPIMALTATARPRAKLDIIEQLRMKEPKCFESSLNRPNLQFCVIPKTSEVTDDLIHLITSKFSEETGIIYCLSRKDCEQLAATLKNSGISSEAYHAGLENRPQIQRDWLDNKIHVLCSTIAFGMGIDKPDVRFVFHHSVSMSIESYMQESGRAGRDGERATCIIFYSSRDIARNKRLITRNNVNTETFNYKLESLHIMESYCIEKNNCRRSLLLELFNEKFDRNQCTAPSSNPCDNCKIQYVDNDSDFIVPVNNINTDPIPTTPIKHKCTICPYQTSNATHLKTHTTAVHDKQKNIKCQIPNCTFSTAHSTNLRKHMKNNHGSNKPFQCKHCPYKCVEKYVLKNHVESAHLKTKLYSCTKPDCQFKTSYPQCLKRHIQTPHIKK